MRRSNRNHRPIARTLRPSVHGLESRTLLSGFGEPSVSDLGLPPADASTTTAGDGLLGILGTSPGPGPAIVGPVSRVAVTFDQPLAPFSLDFFSLRLDRVAGDGSVVAVFDEHPALSFDLDEAGTSLVVTLDGPLAPGRYRIVLPGGSALSSDDFTRFASGEEDRLAGEFELVADEPDDSTDEPAPPTDEPAPPTDEPGRLGPTLADALDLGTPLGVGISVPGTLLTSDPSSSVRLFRIVLPEGTFWRLGLEVRSRRIHSALDPALALFDADGRVVATAELGRSDAPTDPFLFQGLAAGTYYVGVSARGHLPGLPGGYDPATGDPGLVPTDQEGGEFVLDLVADSADAPTRLIAFKTIHPDPTDPRPGGFALQFDGPVNAGDAVAELANRLESGLEVVGDDGRTIAVVPIGYSEADATFTFLFRTRPPAGDYTVRLSERGGLRDLAGRAPVADGRVDGVLAKFTVPTAGASAESTDPAILNLGLLFPDASITDLSADLVVLRPGETRVVRFVVAAPGLYSAATSADGPGLTIERLGEDGPSTLEAGAPGGPGRALMNLEPGVYRLRLAATGDRPVRVGLAITKPTLDYESVLRNGIGQGPALSLRLIAPRPAGNPPIASPPDAGSIGSPVGDVPEVIPPALPTPPAIVPPSAPSPTVVDPSAIPYGPSASQGAWQTVADPTIAPSNADPQGPEAPSASPAGSPLVLSVGGEIAGRPARQADQVAAVGPSVQGALTALAVNQGLPTAAVSRLRAGRSAESVRDGEAPPVIWSGSVGEILAEADESSPAVEVRTGGMDLLDRAIASVVDWFRQAPGEIDPVESALLEEATVERRRSLDDEAGLVEEEPRESQAMAPPIGLALFTAFAVHQGRRAFRRPGKRSTSRRGLPIPSWHKGRGIGVPAKGFRRP